MGLIFRTGWRSGEENGQRYYLHDTGWKVTDVCGPNNSTAVSIAGPDLGKTLPLAGDPPLFSTLQIMLYVERYLRTQGQQQVV